MKLLGVMILVSVGLATGALMSRNLHRRPRELRALRSMLQQIQTEMDYGLTPMPELLRRMAADSDGLAALFAGRVLKNMRAGESLRQAWKNGLDEVYPVTALTALDMESLEVLGQTLGVSHVDDQAKHLRLAMSRIEHNLEEAVTDRDKNAKLYSYLGVITALALVIVLL